MPLLTYGNIYMKWLYHWWYEYESGQGFMSKFMYLSSLVDKWGSLGFKNYILILFMAVTLLTILN